jgi:hypothetical protein
MLRDRISSFVNVGLPLSPGLSRNRKLRQIHFTGYCVNQELPSMPCAWPCIIAPRRYIP